MAPIAAKPGRSLAMRSQHIGRLPTHRWTALIGATMGVMTLWLTGVAWGEKAGKETTLALSSLKPKCALRIEGGVDFGRTWLDCGFGRYFVAHPSNLAGHVTITTPAQALELVRLFSAPERRHIFTDIEDVEVTPAKEDGWYELQEEQFRQHGVPASVVEVQGEQGSTRSFRIKRTVFWTATKSLYELTQVVTPDGFVQVTDRRLLDSDPRRLGMSY
jgi:hypothetical protein